MLVRGVPIHARSSNRRQVSPAENSNIADQVRPGEADRSRPEGVVRAATVGGGETEGPFDYRVFINHQ